jgi:hypothetical protein
LIPFMAQPREEESYTGAVGLLMNDCRLHACDGLPTVFCSVFLPLVCLTSASAPTWEPSLA